MRDLAREQAVEVLARLLYDYDADDGYGWDHSPNTRGYLALADEWIGNIQEAISNAPNRCGHVLMMDGRPHGRVCEWPEGHAGPHGYPG